MYNHRLLLSFFKERDLGFSATLITGPRRSGKTTLAKMILGSWGADLNYYSFDTPEEISFFKNDPSLFFQRLKYPVILDEIQNVPDIMPYIKSEIDHNSDKKNIRYILTGSQQLHLMKGISESLSGRVLIKELLPFALVEKTRGNFANTISNINKILSLNLDDNFIISNKISPDEILHNMLYGGYPQVYQLDRYEIIKDWFSSYVETYIRRDIRDLSNIADMGLFNRFLVFIASRSGMLINHSEIGNEIGVSYKTVQNYLSLLETTYIWKTIYPYFNTLGKRMVKQHKGIFNDTGLLCYLTGINSVDSLQRSAMLGNIFETFVISEFLKLIPSSKYSPGIYFYRTPSKVEVDLVLETEGKLLPIEIKFGATPKGTWGNGINSFINNYGNRTSNIGIILSMNPEIKLLSKNVLNIPISIFI